MPKRPNKKGPQFSSNLKIGAHVSIAGGFSKALERAEEAGLETIQLFTASPRSGKRREISDAEIAEFKKDWAKGPVGNIYVHTPYYVNAASPDTKTWHASQSYIVRELKEMDRLGLKYFVMHVGSHLGAGIKVGKEKVKRMIDESLQKSKGSDTIICLENTAGQKNDIGAKPEIFGAILDPFRDNPRVAAVIDTCHFFAAGYDLRTKSAVEASFGLVDKHIGWDNVPMLHLNDSKVDLGGARDRHENLGKGFIGLKGFEAVLSSKHIKGKDLILETAEAGREADIKWLKEFLG